MPAKKDKSEHRQNNTPARPSAGSPSPEQSVKGGSIENVIPSFVTKQQNVQPDDSEAGDIPQFSLADDIMASQRKVSGLRRRPPSQRDRGEREEIEIKQVGSKIDKTSTSFAGSNLVVAQIVTRDIEKLRRGEEI